jgi:hypothetical protein
MAAGMIVYGKTVPEPKHVELFVGGALFAWDTLQAEKAKRPRPVSTKSSDAPAPRLESVTN